ncbi:MAG TPA: type II secretion system F family protein [Candidatus Obscuribacterales bacterium]
MAVVLIVTLAGGVLLARLIAARRQRAAVGARLARLAGFVRAAPRVPPLIRSTSATGDRRNFLYLLLVRPVLDLLSQAGSPLGFGDFLLLYALPAVAPALIAYACGLSLLPFAFAGACLAAVPVMAIAIKASARRVKFSEQLPDAIDLMVSVLRSGHSVPQAVRAVADELPDPCGTEFAELVHRMSLGQTLPDALVRSSSRLKSYELDLIRRAVSIQAEVGGSLAELLERTNWTLRQRLKLVRQVRVLTAQSRLTACIVALLPVVMAAGLHYLSPGYLRPLFETDAGRILLVAAVFLQLLGLFVMKRMSTMRV